MYSRTAVSLILVVLFGLTLGAIQSCGRYAVHECSYVTEVMGSDYRQCYTGNIKGLVGITLQVEPIAYKILLNRRALRRYVDRDKISNLAEEISGSSREGRTLPKDEKLAAIVREIQRYIYTPAYEKRRAKDRPQLQDYRN